MTRLFSFLRRRKVTVTTYERETVKRSEHRRMYNYVHKDLAVQQGKQWQERA